jgi:hypothetical protein
MTTRFAKTAAFAAAALMTIVAAGCGNGADGARDIERADAVWSQHVDHTGTPLTMQEFETTTWRAKNGDMVMFHDTSEVWPHMAIPTVRSADDHRSTLIPATVTDQSELLQFEFLQYAGVKLDGAYYAVSTYFPDDPANMASSKWHAGADGDLFVLAVNEEAHEGYRVRATANGLHAQCMTDGVKDAGCYQVLFQGLETEAHDGILTLDHVDMGADATTER